MLGHLFQTRATIALTFFIGTCGILVLGVQPLVLASLLHRKVIDDAGIGWAATGEVLLMATGLLIASRVLTTHRRRWIVVMAAAGMLFGNGLSANAANAATVVVLRSMTGFCEGMLIATPVLSIAGATAPGRLSGLFFTLSAIPQVVLAYLLPGILVPAFGDSVGFVIMAGAGFASMIAALAIRQDFAQRVDATAPRIIWTGSVLLALTGSLLTLGAIGAVWSYAVPLAGANGLSEAIAGLAITISIFAQVAGSLFITAIGWRLPIMTALIASCLLQVAAVAAAAFTGDMAYLCVALGMFGFLWQASAPFTTDLIVELDETRGTAPLILPIGFVGFAVGPFIASFAVSPNIRGAAYVAIAGFLLAAAVYAAIAVIRARDRMMPVA